MSPGSIERRWVIPAEHPALAGHFPDKPVVPAVVILDAVLTVVAEMIGAGAVTGFPIAKFLVPLGPDQRFTIRLGRGNDHRFTFTCILDSDATLIAQGVIATVETIGDVQG